MTGRSAVDPVREVLNGLPDSVVIKPWATLVGQRDSPVDHPDQRDGIEPVAALHVAVGPCLRDEQVTDEALVLLNIIKSDLRCVIVTRTQPRGELERYSKG